MSIMAQVEASGTGKTGAIVVVNTLPSVPKESRKLSLPSEEPPSLTSEEPPSLASEEPPPLTSEEPPPIDALEDGPRSLSPLTEFRGGWRGRDAIGDVVEHLTEREVAAQF